jgi:hypothetical protein
MTELTGTTDHLHLKLGPGSGLFKRDSTFQAFLEKTAIWGRRKENFEHNRSPPMTRKGKRDTRERERALQG